MNHFKIKEELDSLQGDIKHVEGLYREGEWEYEVKLQQYNYMETERK